MPMFIKMDVYQITARRDGAVYKTKKVAYHWFECGKAPQPYATLQPDLVKQNGLPEGDYYYSATLETVVDSRILSGGLYK